MKKITFICALLAFCHFNAMPQGEATNWYFGVGAGLDFNSGSPVLDLNGQLSTNEGCGTISDANGQLLFYTDGIWVWDRNHNQMPNGYGLLGDPSSSQSGIIVPQPGSSNIYYIFTMDSSAGDNGFRYSIVDMSLNNGNGDVTSVKNVLLKVPTVEKISAVRHANGIDFWVITHEWLSNKFLAYRITPSGISENPIVSSVGTIHGSFDQDVLVSNIANTIGYLKISPDGQRLASAKFGGEDSNIEIFDFNANTGVISNPILIDDYFYEAYSTSGAYGVEFSPDSKILYVTDKNYDFSTDTSSSKLHQFDLTLSTSQEIKNSGKILYEGNNTLGALQLAIDGKIYVSNADKTALDAIENPNILGLGSNYQIGVIDLGGRLAKLGLPPFVQSLFNATFNTSNSCLGSEMQFELNSDVNVTSALWNFDDGTTSTEINPAHIYSSPGTYTVTVDAMVVGQSLSLTKQVVIYETPIANTAADYFLCEDLDNNGLATFNLGAKVNEILGSQSILDFSVLFFATENEAMSGINPLDFIYETTSFQTIYARVQNNFNSTCFDISSFDLYVLETPRIVESVSLSLCDKQSIRLEAEVGFDGYNWSNGQNTSDIVIDSAGIYTVEIIRNHSTNPAKTCSRTKVFTVVPSSNPEITDIQIEEWGGRNSISVFVNGSGDYEFSLDNVIYQESNIFPDLLYGDHTVYVRDKNGCGVISKDVFILDYPKFFTPNNDGYNSYWIIEFPNSERDFELFIYDRYGKQLTVLNANSKGWDGTYNGLLMPTSDYWFVLKRPSKNKVYTGHFTLKR